MAPSIRERGARKPRTASRGGTASRSEPHAARSPARTRAAFTLCYAELRRRRRPLFTASPLAAQEKKYVASGYEEFALRRQRPDGAGRRDVQGGPAQCAAAALPRAPRRSLRARRRRPPPRSLLIADRSLRAQSAGMARSAARATARTAAATRWTAAPSSTTRAPSSSTLSGRRAPRTWASATSAPRT